MRTTIQALLFSISVHLFCALGFWGYLTYSEYIDQLEKEKQGFVPVGEVDYGYSLVYFGPFDDNLPLGLTILFATTLGIFALIFALLKYLFKKIGVRSPHT